MPNSQMIPRKREAIARPLVSAASSPGPAAGWYWLMTETWQSAGPVRSPLARPSRLSDQGMRVAVVDIGTNSTRLLVADVEEGNVSELERRSTVTRLGRGVDTSGQLAADAIEDVCRTVGDYIAIYEPLSPDAVSAIATSAVRDAENSGAFLAELRERFALQARMLEGVEE